jgi:hypothetical protein
MTRHVYFADDLRGGVLVGRQVSTVQRTWLEYLRSRGIESTPTRFKDSKDNRIHKSVLLSYKVGAMATKLWNLVCHGLLHTTIIEVGVRHRIHLAPCLIFMIENCIPRDRIARWNSDPMFLQPLDFSGRYIFSSDCHSPTILQRLPFSSDCHSPAPLQATAILQRLPFSRAYHSPAPTILQRLPFSSASPSDRHTPATAILQSLPFSSAYHSPATTILQRLPFSSAYHFSSTYHSPVPRFLWPLRFSSSYVSPAPTFLWPYFPQPRMPPGAPRSRLLPGEYSQERTLPKSTPFLGDRSQERGAPRNRVFLGGTS